MDADRVPAPDLKKLDYEDIVFEGRHKRYGAYVLRREYWWRLLKSFIISLLVFPALLFSTQKAIDFWHLYTVMNAARETELHLTQIDLLPGPGQQADAADQANGSSTDNGSAKLNKDKIEEIATVDPSTVKEVEIKQSVPEAAPSAGSTVVSVAPALIDSAAIIAAAQAKAELEARPKSLYGNIGSTDLSEEAMNDSMSDNHPPAFPGGRDALLSYLESHIEYPFGEKEVHLEGISEVAVTIDKDGHVKNAEALSEVSIRIDKEAVRVVSNMPPWIAARKKGHAVERTIRFKVPFRIKDL